MLWSRCPLPRSFCAARYKRDPTRIVVHLNSLPLPDPPIRAHEPRKLFKHWWPPQTDRLSVGRMAPKQATLGYVKSSQQTLGKFFGNQNGAKAAPQQSKLKFSSNPQRERHEDPAEEPEASPRAVASPSTNGIHGDGDVKMEDTPVKKSESDDEMEIKWEPSSATSSKKRAASAEAGDVENESEELEQPPTKKQRGRPKKGVATKTNGTSAAKKKPVKVESESEMDVEQSPEPMAAVTKKEARAKHADDDKHDSAGQKKATSNGKATAKAKASYDSEAVEAQEEAAPASSASDAESEVSEDEEDEEEKPEVAAKAREKVQTTLKSPDKTLYPDWKAGDPVPYAALCTTFSKIELTTKRLEIMALCSAFLTQVLRLTPEDLLPTVLLMIGKLAADYAGVELGIGESLIMKAIGETTGRNLNIIKEDQRKIGDLGLVAAKSRSNQPTMFKPKPLTVRAVHEGLMKIATATEGQGSQSRKVDGIKKLLSSADTNLAKGQNVDITKDKGGPSEAKFIIRALEGKMRLGLADKTVQVSIAHAMVVDSVSKEGKKVPSEAEMKKGEEVFKAVYNELPSYEVIVPALLKGGIWNLRETCKLQPGVPLKPMLAKPTKSIGEVLDRFEGKDFTCEYKYDGERAQIHFVAHDSDQAFAATVAPSAGKTERGISNIFSRNSEDLSKKYPDILAKLPTWVKTGTKSFVLDCETVAWDVEKKHVLPFQQLMTRKKKDVKTEDIKVKVCVFAFDLLFVNGEALVNKSFRERREQMYGAFQEVEGEFAFAKFGNTREVEEIETLLEDSVKASCEGLMVKMLDGTESHYEPSRRSQNWLKVKKDYLSGTGDSLDLVVLGAYYGKGKRTSVYGAFHLACYNATTEKYETLCNIGTGFSEAVLAELYDQLSPLVIDRPKPFYDHATGKNQEPDVWFEPRFVWEVKTADLTLSPKYRAAAGEFGGDGVHKGVSLRFPRFIRVRDDKKPDAATSSRQVAEMYRKQEHVGKDKKPAVDDDFEY